MRLEILGHKDLILISAVLGKVGASQTHPQCSVMIRRLFALVVGGERDFDVLCSAAAEMRDDVVDAGTGTKSPQ